MSSSAPAVIPTVAFRQAMGAYSLLLRQDFEGLAERLATSSPSPADFSRFCDLHELRPLLVRALSDERLGAFFEARIHDRLRRYEGLQQRIRERVLDELEALCVAFSSAEIDFVLHKGPYLAACFFGSLHGRFYRDLDLLIRLEDVEKTQDLLRRQGYTRESSPLLGKRLATLFAHGYDFRRGEHSLDLHWSLGVSASYRLDGEELWSEGRRFLFRGHSIRVLSDEHVLTALLISLFEDLQRGALKLKGFTDLHQVLGVAAGGHDWHGFFERRQRDRTEVECRTMLALYLGWLDLASQYPRLAAAIAAELRDSRDAIELLFAGRGAHRNRRWAVHHSGASRLRAWSWWALSLPARLLVYGPRHRRQVQSRRRQASKSGSRSGRSVDR